MDRRPDPMTPNALLTSWLAALAAIPAGLLAAAAGQGLGGLLAGGAWIGVCLPWDRQPWALVNQPALNFASLPSAGGYWLGSTVLPLALAAVVPPLTLRLRSLAGHLVVLQTAWVSLVVAASWQRVLDPELAHLARWLHFRGLPAELGWIAVAVATALAIPIALRLIALARIVRFNLGRARRTILVLLHLVPAPLAWAAFTVWLRGAVPLAACVAAGLPLIAGLVVAWVGYPAPLTHAVARLRPTSAVALAAAAAIGWAAGATAGRPLPDGRVAALQWGPSTSVNNIRDWMAPHRAPWIGPSSNGSPDRPGPG
ncbi:MAG: hypothetical protein MUC56_03585 [Thermoanaerobaculales bacterium]|nr:hypothetical protein [Thermoanaerobaculales bacterium]